MAQTSEAKRNMPTQNRDLQGVVQWRRAQLLQAGLPPSLAARVARDERYDLHDLIQLVEHGCAPDLAVRILKPIELAEAGCSGPSLGPA
jgi:hypothetical protein